MTMTDRLATREDLPVLHALMDLAIRKLIGAYVDEAHVEAHFETMGVDTQLIDDGTYFVIEIDGKIVGCGGWGRRATLYGGNHTVGRSDRLLDPKTEPARIRAMYTHPDYTRRGIGRRILDLGEAAAKREGFSRLELGATIAGEPLYAAYGFKPVERNDVVTSKGLTVPVVTMIKDIA